ncbi:ParB/RepB/Spo0J family partition protein [Pseudodesulfovibrio sp. F-1]|uniref:ParB/RepB/Spo0J family partition protein n=1 Tax=Pseudodesulfovibrio alkaliphilus TaxID=2661613 RepID=A0A7K1KNP3_9BACT|nr:ParB/RepB/Spo0J family partition protein [Pseudodesulfovibrio alkaliphilus]MUM77620.1 ParB/RepB/Spo0J family partition protein [Pseudodesulfovibrio alkaliphilus]
MVAGNRGLGRGLDALLGGVREDAQKTSASAEVRLISVEAIAPNPYQPRREFSQAALDDLCDSIRARGVLQPVLVRSVGEGRYELVAGERRLRATRQAGLGEIPALVREMTDQESLAIALIENLQREDLNAIEEALGYQQLQREFGLSQEELARQVGKSRSAVANSLRLLSLPEAVRQDIQAGAVSAGHGRAIMSIADAAAQAELHKRIVENGLTVRQAEAQAVFWKGSGRLPGAEELERTTKADTVDAPRRAEPLSPELRAAQEAFSGLLGVRVRISGTMEKGKVTVAYNSKEELRSFAERLGVELD